MSDTPRTDDATWHTRTSVDPIGADVVYASFAAGLERKLAAVTKERNEALARIKRLEEAAELALGYAAKGDFESADNVLAKAKEAKP